MIVQITDKWRIDTDRRQWITQARSGKRWVNKGHFLQLADALTWLHKSDYGPRLALGLLVPAMTIARHLKTAKEHVATALWKRTTGLPTVEAPLAIDDHWSLIFDVKKSLHNRSHGDQPMIVQFVLRRGLGENWYYRTSAEGLCSYVDFRARECTEPRFDPAIEATVLNAVARMIEAGKPPPKEKTL